MIEEEETSSSCFSSFKEEKKVIRNFCPQCFSSCPLKGARSKEFGVHAFDEIDWIELIHLRGAGFSAIQCKAAGHRVLSEFKAAGFSAAELQEARFAATALFELGFKLPELAQVFSAKDMLHAPGVTSRALKDAGYTVGNLKDAGLDCSNLRMLDFSAGEFAAYVCCMGVDV